MRDSTAVPVKPTDLGDRAANDRQNRASRWVTASCALCAALTPLWYWILSAPHGEPFSVVTMYRYGDTEYFGFARALSQGQLGEFEVLERAGGGLFSFPFPGLALHGALQGLIGLGAWPVADAIVGLALFGGLVLLLKAAKVGSPVRELAALMVITRLASLAMIRLTVPPVIRGVLAYPIVTYRIPRPFISYLVEVFAIASVLWLVQGQLTRRWHWAALGLLLALQIQTNVYPVFPVAGCAGIGLLWLLWRDRAARPETGRILANALLMSAVCVAALIPFLAQRLSEHPDVPGRLGVFAVDRLVGLRAALTDFNFGALGKGLVCLALGLLVAGEAGRRASLLWLGVMLALASVALPVSVVVTGKAIQPFHFVTEASVFHGFIALTLCCYAAELAAALAKRRGLRVPRPALALGLVLFLAANIVAGIQAHQARAAYQGHIQPFVKPFEELTRMRPDFTALVREFGREQYKDCKVLGTFDLQAHNWWVAFGPGYVFNPNSFRSTLPDSEIERRVLLLTHVMGLESRPLDEIVLWLGSNKYQANRIHSFAPLDQYAPAEADAIRNVSFIENWHLVLPTTERDRLLALRRSLASQPPEAAPRLDLIVMTNTSDQRQSAPDPKRWGCSFQNATYRVFVRAK